MILLLDTSTPVCRLTLVGSTKHYYEWRADRSLADGLHKYVHNRLQEHNLTYRDVTGLGIMKGPGSFTGLRIGITVFNTWADSANIPIVGVSNQQHWQDIALKRLESGENDKIVLPEYGQEANITKPRQ